MRSYRPGHIDPQNPDSLRREFDSIQEAANRPEPYSQFQVLHIAPVKVFAGMVVNADGTDWNPGSGAGMYLRNSANTAWTFLGSAASTNTDLQTLVAIQTEQLRQLTNIALILATVTGIDVPDDVPLQIGQLQQVTNIALILSSMTGITVDADLDTIN